MVLYIDVGNRSMYDASIQNTQRRYIQTSQKTSETQVSRWAIKARSSFISRPIQLCVWEALGAFFINILSLRLYKVFFIISFFWCKLQSANKKENYFFCCERKTFGNFSLSVLLFIIKSMSYAFYGKAIWFMIIDTYVDGWDLFNIDDRSIGFIFNSFFLWE